MRPSPSPPVEPRNANPAAALSNLRIYSSLAELNAAIPPHVPKLILTVPATLSHGYSRSLFVDFARGLSNVVILTGASDDGTLARWLWGVWNEAQKEGEKWGQGKVGKVIELDRTVELQVRSLTLSIIVDFRPPN